MNGTAGEVLREGAARLAAGGVPDADFDARQLYLAASGLDGAAFLLRAGEPAPEDVRLRFEAALARRLAGEPLQYILGEWDFYGGTFAVGPGVLIPRPETEALVDLCIFAVKTRGYLRVWDLCAGTGCIGLSIARACPGVEVVLFEKYEAALRFLRENAKNDPPSRVRIEKADLFNGPAAALPPPDLIVSNPPYIPRAELASLQREVLREPVSALDGGPDGLDFYRCVASLWYPRLKPGGIAAFECGEGQPPLVAAMFPGAAARLLPDPFGVERFAVLQKEIGKD